MKRNESGKGGNFETRKNPFGLNLVPKGGAPDFASVKNMGAVIDALVKAGCAIMLGRTRDEGALVLTILDGDDRHRTYCSSEEELDAAFDAMAEMYKG